jgi:pimeloyl-ACP methyl ester carboxylesterase
MIARGIGFPVLMIPGIQGRHEWMTPAVDALAAGHRVMTASLDALRPGRESGATLLAWMRAIDNALDNWHERRVSIVGVSFGGLIGALYAARRPDRVISLTMVSTPAPVRKPNAVDLFCVSMPVLGLPVFGVRGAWRLWPELVAARDTWPLRCQISVEHATRVIRAPLNMRRSAQWVREWLAYDISDECRRITAPTMLVTGEAHLDRTVPMAETREYLRLIAGARHNVLPDTGHVGLVTKPHRFAEMVGQFIMEAETAERSPQAPPVAASRGQRAS